MKENVARAQVRTDEQPKERLNERPRVDAPAFLPADTSSVRAVNPDNRHDIERLVTLLTSYYGAGHSFDGVYDPEYLMAQVEELDAESSVMSLVVEDEHQFVAHIALRFEQTKTALELLFPAIRPEDISRLFALSHLFWNKLQDLAARQRWQLIYQYSPVSESALQVISAKCFESYEMAVFPNLTVGRSENGAGMRRLQTFLLMHHVFSPFDGRPIYLYPPEHHAAKVEELLAPIQHNRIVVRDLRRASALVASETSVPDVRISYREIPGVHEISIVPHTLQSPTETLDYISELASRSTVDGNRVAARVALDSPACPQFCAALEERGLRFCGIAPFMGQNDYILYTTYDDRSLTDTPLFTPRARALRDYMLTRGRK